MLKLNQSRHLLLLLCFRFDWSKHILKVLLLSLYLDLAFSIILALEEFHANFAFVVFMRWLVVSFQLLTLKDLLRSFLLLVFIKWKWHYVVVNNWKTFCRYCYKFVNKIALFSLSLVMDWYIFYVQKCKCIILLYMVFIDKLIANFLFTQRILFSLISFLVGLSSNWIDHVKMHFLAHATVFCKV